MSGALVYAFCPPPIATMADPERHDESRYATIFLRIVPTFEMGQRGAHARP